MKEKKLEMFHLAVAHGSKICWEILPVNYKTHFLLVIPVTDTVRSSTRMTTLNIFDEKLISIHGICFCFSWCSLTKVISATSWLTTVNDT